MNLENFRVEKAQNQDIPTILNFIRELALYEKLSHEVVATEETLEQSLFGPKPVAYCLIGYFQEEPVAFAIYFYNFSTFLGCRGLYLEDLYVKPAMRGRGIGEKMLRFLAHIAVEEGCGRFEWSVLDWNESAIKFYRKLGAEPMDEWTVFRVTGEALLNLGS